MEMNVKKFNQLNIEPPTHKAPKNKMNIDSMTPGINKRKLTRNANNIIDSDKRQIAPITMLTPARNNNISSKTPSTFIAAPLHNDPLKRFCKPDEETQKKDPLSFLHQLGAAKPPSDLGAPESRTSSQPGVKKLDMFTIPPFKPKDKKNSDTPVVEKSSNSNKSDSFGTAMVIPEIPAFRKQRSNKAEEQLKPDSNSAPEEMKIVTPTSTFNPINFKDREKPRNRPKTAAICTEKGVRNRGVKNMKIMYGKISKNKLSKNKLSVIKEQKEELKTDFKEYIPSRIVPFSPYFNRLLVNVDKRVIMFDSFAKGVDADLDQLKTVLKQIFEFNKEIEQTLTAKTRKHNSTKIDWIKMNDGKKIEVILSEKNAKLTTSYLEKNLQKMIVKFDQFKLSNLIHFNVQYFNNEVHVTSTALRGKNLATISEKDEFHHIGGSLKDINFVSDNKDKDESGSKSQDNIINDDKSQASSESSGSSSSSFTPAAKPPMPLKLMKNSTEKVSKKLSNVDAEQKGINASSVAKEQHDRGFEFPEVTRKKSSILRKSIKRMPNFDQEVTPYGFIKG